MLGFALFLGGCGNLVLPEDPDAQEPAGNINEPDNEPEGQEPDGSNNELDDAPAVTEAELEDLEPLPFSIVYLVKNNLVILDLNDKSSTVLMENVGAFVPDWANQRIALAIPDLDEDIADQGVAEIALYSTIDGSSEILGTSYMGYSMHFSPNGRFLAVQGGMGGMRIYDLKAGEIYDASDANLLVSVNEQPVWAPCGMVYAMPMILIGEKPGPPGIYIIDPVSGESTQIFEVSDRMARPHRWLDEDRLLIEIELKSYSWVNDRGNIRGLGGKDYKPGEFKILDINTGAIMDAEPPVYSLAPEYESSDGAWVLYEEYIDQWPQGIIKLYHRDTNTVYSIDEGRRPRWFGE
jgi:hypothetical protein